MRPSLSPGGIRVPLGNRRVALILLLKFLCDELLSDGSGQAPVALKARTRYLR